MDDEYPTRTEWIQWRRETAPGYVAGVDVASGESRSVTTLISRDPETDQIRAEAFYDAMDVPPELRD